MHLVTAGFGQGSLHAGRILVYCNACRDPQRTTAAVHNVSIPLELVTEDIFVGLYRLGLTASSPSMATELVFGEERPGAMKRAQDELARLEKQG